MITTAANGTIVTNTYNGEGYRVAKAVNGSTVNYLYEYDKVVLELDGAGSETARNIYGTSLLVRQAEGQTAYYMYNAHGDVTALLGADGTILASYYYDAFGNITESTESISNPYKYAGYQHDPETGLYYLNARMYDPMIARFLQEDTYRGSINDPLSLNLYTYCSNEPIMYVDPSGHRAIDINEDENRLNKQKLRDPYSIVKEKGWNIIGRNVNDVYKEFDSKLKYSRIFDDELYDIYFNKTKQNNRIELSSWELAALSTIDFEGVRAYLGGWSWLSDEELKVKKNKRDNVYNILTGKKPTNHQNHVLGWFDTTVEEDSMSANAFLFGRVESDSEIMLDAAIEMRYDCHDIVRLAATAYAAGYAAGEFALISEGVATYGAANTVNMYTSGHLKGALNYDRYLASQGMNNTSKKIDLQLFAEKFKKPVSGKSGKEMAKDVPSWAKGNKPYTSESGNDFAKRLMDEKYGPGNYPTGPASEYNKIKKWGDRGFE
ncbi:MAG: RHS repeat-associated core domain-containing protein [Bacillota bacterium]